MGRITGKVKTPVGGTLSLCFILAAGIGSRMEPFNKKLPKPCLPFINLPLMNYGFYLAKKAGFNHFLLNTHHLPEKLKFYAGKLQTHCSSVQISREDQLLGSGGAFWKARKYLEKEDYFLVANGDSLLVPENDQIFSQLVGQFQRDQSLCTLLTCDHPELLRSLKPVWADKKRNIISFGEKFPETDRIPLSQMHSFKESGGDLAADIYKQYGLKPLHYTGYKVFSRKIFDFLPEGPSHIFSDVLIKAIASGERVSHFHLPGAFWYETGNFHSFLEASREVSQKHWPWLVKVHSFYNQSSAKKEKNKGDMLVFLKNELQGEFPFFKGFNVMGRQVTFSPETVLENTIVADNCQLSENENYKNQFVLG